MEKQINTCEELFSHTFTLRKKVNNLPVILATMQLLSDSGFNCFFTITGERTIPNEKPRWLEIHLYERSSKHSTLTFARLLKSAPTVEDEKAISNINFAISLNAKIMFNHSLDRNQIIINVFSPTNEQNQKSILEYFNLDK